MSSNLVTFLYQLSSQATSQPSQMTAWSPSHQLTAAAFGSTRSRTDSFYPELQYFLRLTPSLMIADTNLRDTMCMYQRSRKYVFEIFLFLQKLFWKISNIYGRWQNCAMNLHVPIIQQLVTSSQPILVFFCLFLYLPQSDDLEAIHASVCISKR